ncbi:uncharacterized protein Pyn_31987 [Prunus yedoensis var. nudiflora]|uniref:AB hydrolase-1 domain-containing protein n=1 Tax=Prunus yedoensis var. nudiflora TaxID=2094558 RepID=A0A314Z325_PRUYE|nr:uncharacterized protein Pyn_31987 [Prunus yedoensis var. nudiflora]
MMSLVWGSSSPTPPPPEAAVSTMAKKCGGSRGLLSSSKGVVSNSSGAVASSTTGFPSFLPKEVEKIKDPYARTLAQRMERLPVQIGSSESFIMSSCVKPQKQSEINPVVLLHCFDSSCLEWRCAYPLLEEAGLEAWAVDVLGKAPTMQCSIQASSSLSVLEVYIRRPMILVGPSLGASVAIDFAVHYPVAVEKLVLINASVYAEGTGDLAKLPKFLAYAGVGVQKCLNFTSVIISSNLMISKGRCSIIVMLKYRYVHMMRDHAIASLYAFMQICWPSMDISLSTTFDWTNVGRLHCLLPWWKDATVSFMSSGGYNVISQIKQVKQKALVICSEQDHIISYKQILRLRCELPYAIMRLIPDSGHLPHVENPSPVAKLIAGFAQNDRC